MDKQNIHLRLISHIVIAYMLMAFAWWSILLFTKNKDAFLAKSELAKILMVAEGTVSSDLEFYQSERYQELQKQYKRQDWMIMGESFVFVISLVIGVWLINRSYIKEMRASQQRRNFLLSITHELKSPIASIQLVLETILKRELPKEKLERLSGNALTETQRLNTLVNNLLLSAQLENAYKPYLEPVDLAELIDDIVFKLEEKFPKASFHFEKPADIPEVIGDRTGLTSVALNLMENAVKYSGSHPEIEVNLIHLNNKIQLTVADHGIGIGENEKKLIFEKFYRVGNEDTRETKGTGLGLYIVHEIVRAHQGNITVSDNSPKGTIFKISLPLTKAS